MKKQSVYPSEINSDGFYVNFYGDPSVGIFDQEWVINGEFTFENESEFNMFKEMIKSSFEYCSDTPLIVESFEEREERINSENNMYNN